MLSFSHKRRDVPVGLLACSPEGELKLSTDLRSVIDLPKVSLDTNNETCLFLCRVDSAAYALATSKGRLFVFSYQVPLSLIHAKF